MDDGEPETPGGGPDGRHGPHVFVEDLARPLLGDTDRGHLERVLRLRVGDELTVSDGRGAWQPARLVASADEPLELTGDVRRVERAEPAITIAFAPVKGDRPELVVQKLTELGVDRMIAFTAARSVVRWDASRAARQLDRLRRVAREAAMQCRRCHLPDVVGVLTFDEVIGLGPVVRAERDGDPPIVDGAIVLIGPEGGWTEDERVAVPRQMALGPQILRAETAAMAAGSLLGALRGGLVRPSHPTDRFPRDGGRLS